MKFKGVKKKMNYNLPAHNLVKPHAFAAMSFCGEPVPFKKAERVMARLRRGADEILDHSEYLAQTEVECLAQVTQKKDLVQRELAKSPNPVKKTLEIDIMSIFDKSRISTPARSIKSTALVRRQKEREHSRSRMPT